ncbi:MAG: hypothetical protein FJZ96_06275 [Chloroflexi bacterium]|nr:hypothetical protein [Chloroflexota bacterium]
MDRSKKILPSVFLSLGLIIALTACGPQPGDEPEVTDTPEIEPVPVTPTEEPVPAIAPLDRAVVFDPALQTDADALLVCGLIYDGLTSLDTTGQPLASLAVSWTVSDDQLDYIFTLQPNVTFSSGAPFNADAVIDNFTRWFDPASPLHGDGAYAGWKQYFLDFKGELDANQVPISQFDGIEKVDDLTVLIHLNRPEPELLTFLAQPYFLIVDPALLASSGAEYGTGPESISGTGAYLLAEWGDAGILLQPNPAYWGGIPSVAINIGWR